jgi:hypothetical protein
MKPAQEHEVVEGGLAAIGPVDQVMTLGEPEPAAREPAAPIPNLKGPPQRRRNRAGAPPHIEDRAVFVGGDLHHSRIAAETPGGFS